MAKVSKILLDAQAALRRFGVDARPYRPVAPRRQQLLVERKIDLVLDVGAHYGEYVTELRDAGYPGSVVSFEPGEAQFDHLSRACVNDPRWSIHQLALSDETGTAELAVADAFSSLLKSNDSLERLWTDARGQTTESVKTMRLDDFEEVTRRVSDRTLLKIDVQGHEKRVLDGAPSLLQRVDVIEIELTVTPLYEGQPLMVEMLRYLDDRGFGLVSLDPIFRDFRTGHHYQYDGLLVRL